MNRWHAGGLALAVILLLAVLLVWRQDSEAYRMALEAAELSLQEQSVLELRYANETRLIDACQPPREFAATPEGARYLSRCIAELTPGLETSVGLLAAATAISLDDTRQPLQRSLKQRAWRTAGAEMEMTFPRAILMARMACRDMRFPCEMPPPLSPERVIGLLQESQASHSGA